MLPVVLPPDPPRLPPVMPPMVRRAEVPPPSVTYLLPDGRLVTVPVGQPLPPSVFAPVPMTMPACPPGSLR